MSVDVMSEADTRFIADNMLTSDDFDLSEPLDITTLAKISQELQLYRQSLAEPDGDHTLKTLSDLFFSNENPQIPLDLNLEEISCDVNTIYPFDRDIKVELTSPNPSPGSTSGYSSQGSWNEECSVTEIEVPESELSESPPESPTIPVTVGATILPNLCSPIVSSACPNPATTPSLVLNPVQITSVHKAKVPIQKLKPVSREIQPKAIKRKLQPCNAVLGKCQPVIISQDNFSQLSANQINLQHPTILPFTSQINQQQLQHHILTTDLSRKASTKSEPNDVKAIKKQQRMIRNRESAFLSRKKRREYVQNLEQHMADLNQEKSRLLAENCQLKERIKILENENRKMKMFFPNTNAKKTTCLMAVLFMLTLNITPFSGLLSSSDTVQKAPVASINHYGRSLLWTGEIEESASLPIALDADIPAQRHNFKSPAMKNSSSCPTYVNKTEALRLEKELRGWAMRVEKQKQKPSAQKLDKKLLVPMPRLHTLLQARSSRQLNVGHKDLEVYSAPRALYEELFDALERRDDTFYFVSFSGDHLLLPASAHNRTQRPKMALVMPAMTLNETTKEDEVTMMQIDCEVMNMHFVEVKESAIPAHLRHKLGHTPAASPQPHNSTSYRPANKNYKRRPST